MPGRSFPYRAIFVETYLFFSVFPWWGGDHRHYSEGPIYVRFDFSLRTFLAGLRELSNGVVQGCDKLFPFFKADRPFSQALVGDWGF